MMIAASACSFACDMATLFVVAGERFDVSMSVWRSQQRWRLQADKKIDVMWHNSMRCDTL